MTLKKLIKNNKLLFRLITSFLIISVLLTGILMVVVTGFISRKIANSNTKTASNKLRQSYTTIYYALTDIYGDNYDLWTRNELVQKALSPQELSQEEIAQISNNLNREIIKNDLVDSVYLINKSSNRVISNVSNYNISTFFVQDSIRLLNEYEQNFHTYKNEIFYPRTYKLGGDSDKANNNLISIVYGKQDSQGKLNSGLIVNINQDLLSKMVNDKNNSSSMIIVNGVGKIISGSKDEFGEILPRDDFYYSIANNDKLEDSFTSNYFGEKSFVTYKKATDLGFVFISVTPYSQLMKEVIKVDLYLGLFFILTMIISIILSIISAKRIYEPLNKIIQKMKDNPSIDLISGDEYTFLDEAYSNLILKNKSSQIQRIFNGTYGDNSLHVLGFRENHKFMIFSLIPDDGQDLTADIMEKIQKLINSRSNMQGTLTSPNCISCIIHKEEFSDKIMEEIMDSLVGLQRIISEDLNITCSIGLGTVVNTLDSIKFSQRYSLNAVQNALKSGDGQIVTYSDIENSKVAASINKDNIADRIQEYVDKNFTRKDFSVEEIKDEVGLSLSYIRQIFKEEKGLTLNDYIINCKIELSKTLLLTTDKTAKEISEDVGYYDNRYFYTLFKKKVGMTTDEFRKAMSQEQTL